MLHKQSKTINPLRNLKSTKTILNSSFELNKDFFVAMAILIGLSSLPFLNELITNEKDGSLLYWIASPETQEGWKGENGRILGYSKLRVLLYNLLNQLYIVIASLGWDSVAKNKSYRNAILVCTASALYYMFIILTENRKSPLNAPELKLWWTLGLSVFLFGLYLISEYRKRKLLRAANTTFGNTPDKSTPRKVVFYWLSAARSCLAIGLGWIVIVALSTLPYLHDIISPRGLGIQSWVPFDGLVGLVELGQRNFLGFTSYRALALTLFVQLLAQSMWAGWWVDAKYSLYKPFLLVPLGLSFFELTVILMVKSDTYLNKPDSKLFLILVLGVCIGLMYYFKNKGLPKHKQESITSVVPQNNHYKNT